MKNVITVDTTDKPQRLQIVQQIIELHAQGEMSRLRAFALLERLYDKYNTQQFWTWPNVYITSNLPGELNERDS